MTQAGEKDDRAGFYWKRAIAVRSRAGTLSTPEAREALLQMAADYEHMAEALTREILLGGDSSPENMNFAKH